MICIALVFVGFVAVSQAIGPCHEELRRLDGARTLMGRFRPSCDANGDYSALQCREAVCYCVHKNGDTIDGFQSEIGLSRGKTCKCARDQAEYKKTGLLGKMFDCDTLGNYATKQCQGSVCFCADSEGRPLLGKEKRHISEKHLLDC